MPAPHEVQAVLIDLDGTLIDSEFAWREAFYDTWAPVYARHPELRERCGEPSTLYDAVYQPLIRAQTAGREWRPEFVREAFAGIIAQHIDGHIAAPGDDGTLATTLYEQYYEAWPAHIVPYPEVRETLEALSGRVRLAIVTNGQSDEQRQKVELSGLGAYFEVVTVSEEVDSLKPDPAIFHHTLERLGVAPASAIHIGDLLAADVAGAKAAGLGAVWLNRHAHTVDDPSQAPHAEIATLEGVLGLVG